MSTANMGQTDEQADPLRLRFTFPAELGRIAHARELAAVFAAKNGVPENVVSDVRLAVSEACTNAVCAHVGADDDGMITLICRLDGHLEIEISDAAGGFVPTVGGEFPDPHQSEATGGYGIPLMQRLASRSEFVRNGNGGTTVRLDFDIDRSTEPTES